MTTPDAGQRLIEDLRPMERIKPIPIPQMRERLSYDPETGIFTWIASKYPSRIGKKAGYSSRGYIGIWLDDVRYSAHRLAWAFVHNKQPPQQIDHINGNPSDNRIANLRPATYADNLSNCLPTKPNKSGYRGVRFKNAGSPKPWKAEIRKHGKAYHIGCFETAEEAGLAYEVMAERLHGQFAFHNRAAAK